MGQSKWAIVGVLTASILSGRCLAEEPAAESPFADPPTSPSVRDDPGIRAQSLLSDEERLAEVRIEAALNQRLKSPLDFVETPLSTVIATIAEEYDLPIHFDELALEAIAQEPEVEVSINVNNVTLRTALSLTLRQLDNVTYIVDREMLLITTEDEAATRLQTRVYQIDDLLPTWSPGRGRGGEVQPRFMPIVEVITRCVDRDSWAVNKAGEGEICIVEPGVMVVTQTQRVHAEIERLLATVRRVKAAIPREAVAARDQDPFGNF